MKSANTGLEFGVISFSRVLSCISRCECFVTVLAP